MQRFFSLLVFLAFALGLAACSKSESTSSDGGAPAAPTQLNWDQGNWNQQNWQ